MGGPHSDDPREGVNVKRHLTEVRGMKLRKRAELAGELASELDERLLILSQTVLRLLLVRLQCVLPSRVTARYTNTRSYVMWDDIRWRVRAYADYVVGEIVSRVRTRVAISTQVECRHTFAEERYALPTPG
jgi:hypothetical protein